MANLKLSVENNEVLTGSRLNCLDVNNKLFSLTIGSNYTYTATQDCILILYNAGAAIGAVSLYIDSKLVYQITTTNNGHSFSVPVKKGQVCKINFTNGQTDCIVYGILH